MKQLDPRQLALTVLQRVAEGGYADRCLDSILRQNPTIDPRDRGLATELVYGILRMQNRLDFALSCLTTQPLHKLELKVLLLLRLGAYQILELDRVPGPVAVHETVALTKRINLKRAAGLINAVLRRLFQERRSIPWPTQQEDPVGHLTWALSLPEWLAERWHHAFGAAAANLAQALLLPAPFTVRVNTLKLSRDQYLEELAAAGHCADPTSFAPEGVTITRRGIQPLPGDSEGWYQVQDEASMIIAHLVSPQEREVILDTCAAPGGKTTHLAALSKNQAQIKAFDLHPQRVRLIEKGAQRLGCRQISIQSCDWTNPLPINRKLTVDAALVDAPCSGLGVLRRNPEARWRLQPGDIDFLRQRQLAILDQVSQLVRPGGRLVYSVCTITAEETNEVIKEFLVRNPSYQRENISSFIPDHWQVLIDHEGALRTLPHLHGMDGFYAARLQKRRQA